MHRLFRVLSARLQDFGEARDLHSWVVGEGLPGEDDRWVPGEGPRVRHSDFHGCARGVVGREIGARRQICGETTHPERSARCRAGTPCDPRRADLQGDGAHRSGPATNTTRKLADGFEPLIPHTATLRMRMRNKAEVGRAASCVRTSPARIGFRSTPRPQSRCGRSTLPWRRRVSVQLSPNLNRQRFLPQVVVQLQPVDHRLGWLM